MLTHTSSGDQRQPEHARAAIKGADSWGSNDEWSFSAPNSFAQALVSLYGVEMCFTFSQPASPALPAKQLQNAPDIVLESQCGNRVGLFGLVSLIGQMLAHLPSIAPLDSLLATCASCY